jgi:hypothetical protein
MLAEHSIISGRLVTWHEQAFGGIEVKGALNETCSRVVRGNFCVPCNSVTGYDLRHLGMETPPLLRCTTRSAPPPRTD